MASGVGLERDEVVLAIPNCFSRFFHSSPMESYRPFLILLKVILENAFHVYHAYHAFHAAPRSTQNRSEG